MKIIFALFLIIATLATSPVPRCRVEHSRGRAYLVCPCKGVTYQCEDVYLIQRYRGGR